jgi:hypothetical protein
MGISTGAMGRNEDHSVFRPISIVLIVSMFGASASASAEDGKIDFQVLPVPPTLGLPDARSNFVIRSAEEWYAWLDKLTDVVEPLPTVDFARYTLLVANAGYKPHGPVAVKFDSVTDMENEIRVQVSVAGPASCPSSPEPGHYAAMALIPQTDKPIQFDVSTRESTCRY